MESHCKKTSENRYFAARKQAAKYNDKLRSREYAAEMIGCSVSTLSDYELGLTKIVPPDRVCKMADLYNAPELRNQYCSSECPIGKHLSLVTNIGALETITLKLISKLRPSLIEELKDDLIRIAADGVIDCTERQLFNQCLRTLTELKQSIEELSLLASKIEERID